jgi:DNA repair protein REV1
MGHGLCESFTKQTTIIAPGGKATNNEKILGDHAWKLLKSLHFDPMELRGIGIQVQKLEKADFQASGSMDQQQAVLPFKPATNSRKESMVDKARPIRVEAVEQTGVIDLTTSPPTSSPRGQDAHKPAARSEIYDLPSYSQVDISVLEALPEDLRAELESEYKRRSVTPAYNGSYPVPSEKGKGRARSESIFREALPHHKIVVKGTSNMDVKHITRQLAPKNRTGISSTKSALFNDRQPIISSKVSNSVKLKVSEVDLRKLDIDPEVFAALPPDLQREQIALAKHAKAPERGAISYAAERKVLKPSKRTRRLGTPGVVIPPPPPPQACYPEPPSLKQRGKKKGEKLFFTETEDVQDVVEKWFYAFREKPPNSKDIEFFETWLVRCVDGTISTDCGVEKGIKVMKWWMVLLKREFGSAEAVTETVEELLATPGRPDTVNIGQLWWTAFRGVKAKMDAAARRKFGGNLSLR